MLINPWAPMMAERCATYPQKSRQSPNTPVDQSDARNWRLALLRCAYGSRNRSTRYGRVNHRHVPESHIRSVAQVVILRPADGLWPPEIRDRRSKSDIETKEEMGK